MHALDAPLRALNLAYAGLLAWVWVYLVRLERTGCQCAMDYRRTYVVAYLAVRVAALLLANLAGWTVPALAVAMAPADVVFVVFALQYVHALRAQKCECSQDAARDVLRIVAVVDAVVAAAAVLLLATLAVALRGFAARTPAAAAALALRGALRRPPRGGGGRG